jgi:exodeoxyribonuclease VII small subunit
MAGDEQSEMTYEQKESRLDEILNRLDNSETPMDELASEAKEAAQLITSMHTTLRSARQEITAVFDEMEKQKEALSQGGRTDPSSDGETAF